jgi:hypothetical protein
MKQGFKIGIVVAVGLIMLVAALLYSLTLFYFASIENYSDCANSIGHKIIGSYPLQCRTMDNRVFAENIVPPADGCKLAGCRGTVCVDASSMTPLTSSCDLPREYQCYRHAKCERQPTGKCDWTPTSQLTACLLEPFGF